MAQTLKFEKTLQTSIHQSSGYQNKKCHIRYQIAISSILQSKVTNKARNMLMEKNMTSVLAKLTIAITLFLILFYSNSIHVDGQEFTSSNLPSDLETYHDSDLSLRLGVPSDWDVSEEKNGLRVSEEKNEIYVEVNVHDLETDLNTYVTDRLSERNEGRNDFKLLELNQTSTSENMPMVKGLYTFKSDSDTEKVKKILRYWIANEDKLYSVGYVSDLQNYDVYLPTAQKIMDSLQIGNDEKNIGGVNSDEGLDFPPIGQTSQNNENDGDFGCDKLFDSCDTDIGKNPINGTQANTPTDITDKYFELGDSNITSSIATNATSDQSGPTQDNITGLQLAGADLQVYENPTLGVKILYPNGWNSTEDKSTRYSVVTFLSPQESGGSTVQEKFLLRINNEPTDMTLDEYTKNINESVQNNSNFQVTNTNSTVLGNNPASSVTGILKEGDKNLQVLDVWTIKDGKVYRIVFYSDPGKADSFEPQIQKILESFSITK